LSVICVAYGADTASSRANAPDAALDILQELKVPQRRRGAFLLADQRMPQYGWLEFSAACQGRFSAELKRALLTAYADTMPPSRHQ